MFLEFTQAKITEDGELKVFGKVTVEHNIIQGYYQPVDRFDIPLKKGCMLITPNQCWCIAESYDTVKQMLEDAKLT